MKKIILLFIVLFSLSSINAQNDKSIVGKWRVVSFRTNDVFLSKETDSVWISDKLKNNYKTAIGQQNEIAHHRMNNLSNFFIFSEKNEYEKYLTEDKRVLLHKGKYELQNNSIVLNAVTRAETSFTSTVEYHFENEYLHLLIKGTRGLNFIHYVLEKIE